MQNEIPWFSSALSLLFFTIFCTAALHLAFVKLWPLSNIQWKQIDYIWVSLALLGVLASIGKVRQEIAANIAESYSRSIPQNYTMVRNAIIQGTHCQVFVRSQFSPPEEEFNRLAAEEKGRCAWFEVAKERFEHLAKKKQSVKFTDLGGPVPGDPADYRVQYLMTSLNWLAENEQEFSLYEEEALRKPWETVLYVLGPWLLAFALSLRLTKVTGEVRLELAKVAQSTARTTLPERDS